MAVDIAQIKTNIKSVLDTANSTLASYDLSTGLSRRVRSVNKYNPEKLYPFTANNLPSVFVWTESKTVTPETIAGTMSRGKRSAKVSFNIAGVFWNPYTSTITEDPADTDCEKLMENIEEVLRASDDLSSTVKWNFPTDVTYHSAPNDEQSHLRIGILSLEARVFY